MMGKSQPFNSYGFIKGPTRYENKKWNNYNFSSSEILNCEKESLQEGMRVKFKLVYDAIRSERERVPLYRAINIEVFD